MGAREGVGVPWDEAEDPERDLQEGLDAEFPGQDRVPEGEPERQEAVREHPGLDPGGVEGAEGAGPEGLRRHQREDGSGPCPLREGEVLLLEVSKKPCRREGGPQQVSTSNRSWRFSSGTWGFPTACLSGGGRLSPSVRP